MDFAAASTMPAGPSGPRVLIGKIKRRAAGSSIALLESLGFEVMFVKGRHASRRSARLAKMSSVGLRTRSGVDRPVLDKNRYFTLTVSAQAGIVHLKSALGLLIKEAVLLNRTPVVFTPRFLNLHNFGRDVAAGWDKYLDLTRVAIVKDGISWDIEALRSAAIGSLDELAVLEVRGRHLITAAENETYDLIVKDNASGLGNDSVLDHSDFDFEVTFRPSNAIRRQAEDIRARLGDYHAMHVRRGDKLTEARYPNLDRDTRPEAIRATLARVLPSGSTIYILTDERTPHFFDILKADYRVFQYFDFPELRRLVDGDHPDNFYLYEIEQLIFEAATTKIYTFAHPSGGRISLTQDIGWT